MISSAEMKELERKSNESGVTNQQLMENAGREVFNILNQRFDLRNKKILIVCYHGNNGGDGFVSARYLCDIAEVDVLFIGEEEKLKEPALMNYKKLIHNEKIQVIDEPELIEFDDFDIIIDAILGIGYHGKLRENILNVIERINESHSIKVSIDVPTGIHPDTGSKGERFINPDIIITFHDIKQGLNDMKDKTVIADIGLVA